MLDDLIGSLLVLSLCLLHEVGDRLLEVVNAPAHLIDAPDDVVAHGLEAGLHLGEHLLDQLGKLVGRVVPSPGGSSQGVLLLLLLMVLLHFVSLFTNYCLNYIISSNLKHDWGESASGSSALWDDPEGLLPVATLPELDGRQREVLPGAEIPRHDPALQGPEGGAA